MNSIASRIAFPWAGLLVAVAAGPIACGGNKSLSDGRPGTGQAGTGAYTADDGGSAGTGGQAAGGGGQAAGGGVAEAGAGGAAAGTGGAAAGEGGQAAGGGGQAAGGGGQAAGAGGAAGSATTLTCADLFDQSALQEYQVEISDVEWAKLTIEFQDIADVLAGNPHQTYHPITFHYGSETVTNAAMRLKGQSSWVDTVSYDANPKMQFVVAFDQIDPKGAFHGLGKIEFDMPRSDWSFLNERIANAWFRQMGILVPCANSAKLTINGTYYGLYTTEESKGGRLIKEFFPGNSSGDFFKGGVQANGSNPNPNWLRQQQFWNAKDITAVTQIVDLPHSLLEWASEAILNNADGYYGGSHNFYLYDQGAAGYVFVPTDVDATVEWMSVFTSVGYKQHPIFWWANRPFPQPPGQHYLIVMNDPTWRARYVDALTTQMAKWNVAQIQGWIDTWSTQISHAVDADPHKWATSNQFRMAVAAARDVVAQRPAYLQSFVACEHGQPADDKDGDGVVWCDDCADNDPSVHPGAVEVCGNNVDDNCSGVVDENCPGEQPGYPGQMAAGGAGGGTGGAGGH
jgi:CotH kinase protein/Putative metal-binding motif